MADQEKEVEWAVPDQGIACETLHVGLTVDDLDRASALFTDLFGYRQTSRAGRIARGVQALMDLPDADIEVIHLHHPVLLPIELIQFLSGSAPPGTDPAPNRTGFSHLSFRVVDIDAAIARAARHGVTQIGLTVGSRRVEANSRLVAYLRSPDRIHFEFIQHGISEGKMQDG